MEVFPSPGRVLAIMMTLGGAPGLERRIEVRIPRSDSAILDIELTLPAIASSLNLEGRRAELLEYGRPAISGSCSVSSISVIDFRLVSIASSKNAKTKPMNRPAPSPPAKFTALRG